MPINPESSSRAIRWQRPEIMLYTDAPDQSVWGDMLKELSSAYMSVAFREIAKYDVQPEWSLMKRPAYAEHSYTFRDWMCDEGYTLSWQEVWAGWRALGEKYQVIPPDDNTVVVRALDQLESEGREFTVHSPHTEERDILPFIRQAITYTVTHTFLDQYEQGQISPETLFRIHWLDSVNHGFGKDIDKRAMPAKV